MIFFPPGSVSAFRLPGDMHMHNPELWQLEPETPVPKELVFTLTPGPPEIKIRPVFRTITSQQFLKVCVTDELI